MGYNKITLYGGQICDYLYIEDSRQENSFDENRFSTIESEPDEWNENTLLFAKFKDEEDNFYSAGDSSLTESIVGYEIRRRFGANPYSEYVGTIREALTNHSKFIIDYFAKNNSDYTYYLYPTSKPNKKEVLLPPSVADSIKTDWDYWSLLVVDETEIENVFYLNKLFKFEFNVKVDDMTNNATVSVEPNFTPYPSVQYGASNYWSSALSSLCGMLSCNDFDYIQTPNMIKELKELTSDTRRKFLKDIDGNIWEVKITGAVNITTDETTLDRIKSVKIIWSEVGDVSGISVINNPNSKNVEWILTESGKAIPYINYEWNSNSRWDNSLRWTSNNKLLDVDISNMGRDLFAEEDV